MIVAEGARRRQRPDIDRVQPHNVAEVHHQWQPLPGPQMEHSSGSSGSHATRCRARTDPTSNAATRRPAPRKNKAGVQLALLASCGGKRWVVEYAGPVLDELDTAVEGSAIDHVERDVGVAVVDAF